MNLMCTDYHKKDWREETRSQLHLTPLSIGLTSKPSSVSLAGIASVRSPSVVLKVALH